MASDALHYSEIAEILETGEFNDLPEMVDAINANLDDYFEVEVTPSFDEVYEASQNNSLIEKIDQLLKENRGTVISADLCQFVVFNREQAEQITSDDGYGESNGYYWSDNGGDSDGGWVAKLDDIISGEITLPSDMVMPDPINGYQVEGYNDAMKNLFVEKFGDNYIDWCGWSSSHIAFICDSDNNRFAGLVVAMAEILLGEKEAA